MKRILLLSSACLLSVSMLKAQTVTSFAGKVNPDPTTNFTNATADVDQAYFNQPEGMAWDQNGEMFVTEGNKIRLIRGGKAYNRNGTLGDPTFSLGYKNGAATAAKYFSPTSITANASGDFYIVDSENHAIRKLTKFTSVGQTQTSSTFAGGAPSGGFGVDGYKDGTGTAARFSSPKGITVDGSGNFYVTDFANHCIRKITSSGVVTTISGKGTVSGNTDATGGANVRYTSPYGIAMLDANTLVVSDFGNSSIRKVNISTGSATTICGGFGNKDGSFTEARFRSVRGIAVVNGLIYVADGTAIRVIDEKNQTVSTFAGNMGASGNKDGVGTDARFGTLFGLAYDGSDGLYATDHVNHIIKKITIDDLAPTADFSVTKTNIEINEEITISDISGGKEATKRNWVVELSGGGSANVVVVQGDLNADKDITVKFTATGLYKVTLTVTNEFGTDMVSKSIINVSTVGIEEVGDLAMLKVFPNPVTGTTINLNLEQGSFDNTNIRLMNLQGVVVAEYTANGGTAYQMNIPELTSGVYYIMVKDNSILGSKKLLIQ